jgi:WD40 repeat protein
MVQFAEFCSSGKYFITASVDGSVIIWTVKDHIINLMRINILESKKIINCQFEDSKNNNSEYDISSFFSNKSKKQIKNKGTQTYSYDFS